MGWSHLWRFPQLESGGTGVLHIRFRSTIKSPSSARRRVPGSADTHSHRRPSKNTLRHKDPSTVPPNPDPIMDSAASNRWRADMNAKPVRNRSGVVTSLKSIGRDVKCSRRARVACRSAACAGGSSRPSARLKIGASIVLSAFNPAATVAASDDRMMHGAVERSGDTQPAGLSDERLWRTSGGRFVRYGNSVMTWRSTGCEAAGQDGVRRVVGAGDRRRGGRWQGDRRHCSHEGGGCLLSRVRDLERAPVRISQLARLRHATNASGATPPATTGRSNRHRNRPPASRLPATVTNLTIGVSVPSFR